MAVSTKTIGLVYCYFDRHRLVPSRLQRHQTMALVHYYKQVPGPGLFGRRALAITCDASGSGRPGRCDVERQFT